MYFHGKKKNLITRTREVYTCFAIKNIGKREKEIKDVGERATTSRGEHFRFGSVFTQKTNQTNLFIHF